MREVAVVGVGMAKFGVSENTGLEMFSEARMDALAESNLEPKNTVVLLSNNEVVGYAEGQISITPRPTTEIDFPGGRGTLCPRILQKLECYGPSTREKAYFESSVIYRMLFGNNQLLGVVDECVH